MTGKTLFFLIFKMEMKKKKKRFLFFENKEIIIQRKIIPCHLSLAPPNILTPEDFASLSLSLSLYL